MKIRALSTIALAMLFTPASAFSATPIEAGRNAPIELIAPTNNSETKAQCAYLLDAQFTVPVYTSFAARSPMIRQSYATCYFDSVVGVIQDHILALQRKELDASPLRDLHVARAVPTAVLLNERTKSFLDTRLGPVSPQTALHLVDIGSPVEVIKALKNIDLPLFKAGRRDAYDGVLRTMSTAQNLVSLSLQHRYSDSKILAATRYYLGNVLQGEFSSSLNSDVVFHLDEVEVLYDQITSSKLTRDLSASLKSLVDKDQYALVLLDTSTEAKGHSRHVARLIGYRADISGKVLEVILQDTYSHNGRNSEWPMTIGEFESRYRGIIPLKVHGRFIQKSNAQIPFHAIK